MSTQDQQRFFQSQIQEIKRYVQSHPEENQDQAILHWIEKRASAYRKEWEKRYYV